MRITAPVPAAADAFWAANIDDSVGEAARLPEARATIPDDAWGRADDLGDRYASAAIRTSHPDHSRWEEPVLVTLRDRDGDRSVVGIERPRYTSAL